MDQQTKDHYLIFGFLGAALGLATEVLRHFLGADAEDATVAAGVVALAIVQAGFWRETGGAR